MRRFIVLIVTLGLLVASLAVADPDPAPPSNTGAVTGAIFREANDQFLSTIYFPNLESDVVFLQFDMPSTVGTDGFQIGGSTHQFGLYLAGLLQAMIEGTTGNLGGGATQTITYDDVYAVDGAGLITGKTETRRINVEYTVDMANVLTILAGLGPMGIGLEIDQSKSNSSGNFQPGGGFPGAATWTNLGVTPTNAQATTVSTFDAAGIAVAVSSQAFGLGEDKDQALDVTASVGMPLSVAGIDLAVGGELLVGFRNEGESAQTETFSQVIGSGTSIDYTPLQALNDGTPAAIVNLTAYSFIDAMEINKYTQIQPMLFAQTDLALNEAVTAHAGLNYTLGLPLYSAKWTDAAGADLKVSGTADTYSSTTVATAVNATDPTLTTTTTTVVNGWESEDLSGMTNTVDLSLGVIVEPTERFRFGVMYQPMVQLMTSKTTYAGSSVQVVTVEDGDLVSGVGDSVTESTVTRGGYRDASTNLMVTNVVNTAAQFFLMPERLRVNLGARVDNVMINRTLTETITDGLIEYSVRTATDTSAPVDPDDYVPTAYDILDEVRIAGAAGDDAQTVAMAGSSTIDYEGGITFFFDESMFLDLRMTGAGGNIWDTSVWSLEMTILY